MPRKPRPIKTEQLHLLLVFIKAKSNLSCNNNHDIQQLQEKIAKKTGELLSVQTLNRLFGLVKNNFYPSLDTLNIAARFCDYQSFKNFIEINFDSHIQEAADDSPYKLLLSVFGPVDATSNNNSRILLQVVENFLKTVEYRVNVAKEIYTQMAATPFGKRFFFERFFNFDALNTSFGTGLEHYLLHAANREERLFAYASLCLKYFLSNDRDVFHTYYQSLMTYELDEVKIYRPYSIAGYCSARIFYQYLQPGGTGINDRIKPMFEFLCKNNSDQNGVYIGALMVCNAFVLTGAFAEADDLLRDIERNCKLTISEEVQLRVHFRILKLVAQFFSGRINRRTAIALFNELKSEPVYFLSSDYDAILLAVIEKNLFRNGLCQKQVLYQWHHLVEKTGFHFFTEFIQNYGQPMPLMEINGKKGCEIA